jgi:hypothetical protein
MAEEGKGSRIFHLSKARSVRFLWVFPFSRCMHCSALLSCDEEMRHEINGGYDSIHDSHGFLQQQHCVDL